MGSQKEDEETASKQQSQEDAKPPVSARVCLWMQAISAFPSDSVSKCKLGCDLTDCYQSSGGAFTWFELLFAADPTWVDYLLITAGTLFAAAAGVPFPLMGVIFGQLVDNFNSATCAAEGVTPINPFEYESAINDKVIQTAYIGAIALVLIYGHLTCWNIISQRLAQRMRVRYVSAMLCQPPSVFDVRQASGQVSSRLSGDITAIQAGTSEKVGNIITAISFFVTGYDHRVHEAAWSCRYAHVYGTGLLDLGIPWWQIFEQVHGAAEC